MSTVGPYQMLNSLAHDVQLQVQHGEPDPHGGDDLNKEQAPVGNSSFTPSNSIRSAPTANVRGAKIRFRWLSWTTAASTCDSSPSLITRTSWRTCAATTARRLRRGLGLSGLLVSRTGRCHYPRASGALGTRPHPGRRLQQPTLVLAPPGTTSDHGLLSAHRYQVNTWLRLDAAGILLFRQ